MWHVFWLHWILVYGGWAKSSFMMDFCAIVECWCKKGSWCKIRLLFDSVALTCHLQHVSHFEMFIYSTFVLKSDEIHLEMQHTSAFIAFFIKCQKCFMVPFCVCVCHHLWSGLSGDDLPAPSWSAAISGLQSGAVTLALLDTDSTFGLSE